MGEVSKTAITFLKSSDFTELLNVNLFTKEGRKLAVDIGRKHELFFDGREPTEPVNELDPLETFLVWRKDWERCCKLVWGPVEGNNRLLALWFLLHQMVAKRDGTVKSQSVGDESYLTNGDILGEATDEPNSGAMKESLAALTMNPKDHVLTKPNGYLMQVITLSENNPLKVPAEVMERRLITTSYEYADDKKTSSEQNIAGAFRQATPTYILARDHEQNSLHEPVATNSYRLRNLANGQESNNPFKDEKEFTIKAILEKLIRDPAEQLNNLNDEAEAINLSNDAAVVSLPVIHNLACKSSLYRKANGLSAWDLFNLSSFPFYYQFLSKSELFRGMTGSKYNCEFVLAAIKTERLLRKSGLLPNLDDSTLAELNKTLNGQVLENIGKRTPINDLVVATLFLCLMHAMSDVLGHAKLELMQDAMATIAGIKADLTADTQDVIDFMINIYMHIAFFSKYYKEIWDINTTVTISPDGKGASTEGKVRADAVERAIGIKVAEDLLQALVEYGVDPKMRSGAVIDTEDGEEWTAVLTDDGTLEQRAGPRKKLVKGLLGRVSKKIRSGYIKQLRPLLTEGQLVNRKVVFNFELIMIKKLIEGAIERDQGRGKDSDPKFLLKQNMIDRGTWPFDEKDIITVMQNGAKDMMMVKEPDRARPTWVDYRHFTPRGGGSLIDLFDSGFISKSGLEPMMTEDEKNERLTQFFKSRDAPLAKKNDNEGGSARVASKRNSAELELPQSFIDDEAGEQRAAGSSNKSKKQRTDGDVTIADDESEVDKEGDDMEIDAQTANTGTTSRNAVTLDDNTTKQCSDTTVTEKTDRRAEGDATQPGDCLAADDNLNATANLIDRLNSVPEKKRVELVKTFGEIITETLASLEKAQAANGREETALQDQNDEPTHQTDQNDALAAEPKQPNQVDEQLKQIGLTKSGQAVVSLADHVWSNSLGNIAGNAGREQEMKAFLEETGNVTKDNGNMQKYVQAAFKYGVDLTVKIHYNNQDNQIAECTIKYKRKGNKGKRTADEKLNLQLYRDMNWSADDQEGGTIIGYFGLTLNEDQDK